MDDGTPSLKQKLRREMRERRYALAPGERTRMSTDICGRLSSDKDIRAFALRAPESATISVYMPSRAEIDIEPFIRKMLDAGVRVAAPRWNGEAYDLAVLKGFGEGCLGIGPMGIREPAEAELVPPREVGVWIVPGLAFTKAGARLGYGGGWYDRLLASASGSALKIGVAYSFQIVDSLPSEPHDITLSHVIVDSIKAS